MRSHRLLSFTILFTLILTGAAMPSAQSQSADSILPYVYSNYVFPPNRYATARHTIRLAIPRNSPPIYALKLTAPEEFTPNRRVEVFRNTTGEKLPASVNVNGKTVELNFDKAVEAGTAVNIEINNVRVWGVARYYDLAVKFANDNRNADSRKLKLANDQYVNIGRTDLRRS